MQRNDINRAYLRRSLSIAECMAVEERLRAAGYQIEDAEEAELAGKELNSKGSHRFLNEAEEKDLGRKIQLARRLTVNSIDLDPSYVRRVQQDAERAKEVFLTSNARYVEHLARRMGEHAHLSLEDIKQEGYIGLLHAVDLFNPERGFRFKTYATWWIEQKMRRVIANSDRTIRLPVHIQEKLLRIKKATAKLRLANGRAPSLDEIAKAVGIANEKLVKLLWHVQMTDCARGDEAIGDDATLLSLVEDPIPSTFDVIVDRELHSQFNAILKTLTPREETVIRLRFGIDLDQDYTLESIAQRYALTRERIRQIEAKALTKLRHPVRSEKLAHFLGT